MRNSFKVFILSAGLIMFSASVTPALAQSEKKGGFWSIFSGGAKNEESNSRPVYTGSGNTSNAAMGGRSATSGIYASAAASRQAKSDRAKAAVYDLPPAQPVDAIAAAEDRMRETQSKVAARIAAVHERARQEEAALAQEGQQQGYQNPYGAPVTPQASGTQKKKTRVLYKRESDSGKKPIRLFDLQ